MTEGKIYFAQIPSKIGTLVHNLGDQHEYRSLHAVDALFTEPDGAHLPSHACMCRHMPAHDTR